MAHRRSWHLRCGRLSHEPHGLLRRPQRMRHEPEVDERRLVTVTFFVLVPAVASRTIATSNPCSRKSRRWASTQRFPAGPAIITFSIRRFRNWSTRSLEEVPYTLCGLATIVSHACEIRLEPLRPVGARAGEPLKRERAFPSGRTQLSHQHFERSAGRHPLPIRRVVIMRGEDHWILAVLRRSQQGLDILGRLVRCQTFLDEPPDSAAGSQKVVLKIRDNERRLRLLNHHAGNW